MAGKADIRQVRQVAQAHGLAGRFRRELGNAIEDAKEAGSYPVDDKGNLSWKHLNEIAENFKMEHDLA